MEQISLVFSVVFFSVFIVYCIFSVYILRINQKSMLNRTFFMVCIAFCIWSFGFAFAISAPNLDACIFWRRFSAFGWGSAYSFILHFFLVLTNKKAILKKWWIYFLLYGPAVITIFIFGLPNNLDFVQYNMVLTDLGWVNQAANTIWDWFYDIYYGSFTIIGMLIIWFWGRRALDAIVKKQANLIFGTFLTAIFIGTMTDIVSNSIFSLNIPQLAPIVILLPVAVVNYSIGRYGLMRSRKVSHDISILNGLTRSVIYTYISAVAVIGSLLYLICGYVYHVPDMVPIYTYSIILLCMGVAVGIIRRLKISDRIKDTANISIIAAAIPVVTLRFIENAGVTVWAFPIIIIVFSLVFNKRYILIAFSVSIILTQIIVWILVPTKQVTIDSMDHILRLCILGIAIFMAFYVNKIYVIRLKENSDQTRLQKLISEISSDFVTVNTLNMEERINIALEKSGRSAQADRVFIVLFNRERNTMTCRYEWCNEGVEPGIGSVYNVPFEQYPWLMERIQSNQTIEIKDIQKLPPEARLEMIELVSFDVCGMVVVPIRSKDTHMGFIGIHIGKADIGSANVHLVLFEVVSNILSDAFTKIDAEKEINEMAFLDHLTKLPNRSLFKDRVDQAIFLARRTNKMIGIMFLDLDSFKNVNDTMGHEGGDELIKNISQVLLQNVRRSDTVSRFGGDEFLIMINNLPRTEDIIKVAKGIMKLFNKNYKISQQEFFVTASAGIAVYPFDGEDTDTLIKNADIAMYSAKAKGKNQYVLCTKDMKEEIQQKMKITNHLYRALEKNELILYYQPQVSLPNGEIVGMEALLRWNQLEMGMIPPGTFIPLAEQTGLINSIGEWVLWAACSQTKQWQDMGLPHIRIAVNVSVNQLRNPAMVDQVKSILAQTGLKPEYLEIEITESIAINESEYILGVLNNLKKIGISISIDDFGTEYSSLSRLKILPIDRLKMDMQFVRGIEGGNKDKAIAKVIISLAKNLNIKVIAEGVETELQKEFLSRKMCDEVQGYYYYKPMPAEEMEKVLGKLR